MSDSAKSAASTASITDRDMKELTDKIAGFGMVRRTQSAPTPQKPLSGMDGMGTNTCVIIASL